MRIAICLSGYFRLYREIYPNFYKYLLMPCRQHGTVDLFISSWDTLNSSSSFSVKQGDTPPDCGPFDWDHILSTYQPRAVCRENFEEVKEDFHLHRYDSSVDLSTLHPNIHDNGVLFGLAMWYRRFHCNELKKRAEEVDGAPYDLVIQMRPDVFFLRPFNPAALDVAKLSARTFYSDLLLASTSEHIDRVSLLYTEAGRIARQYGATPPFWFDIYCPEYFFEHYLKELGFEMTTNRVELGQDSMWVYPRRNFAATIYDVLQKCNRLSDLRELLTKPDGSLLSCL